MENASDALVMAGQILIFIIALTVCITSFSKLRENVDGLISQTDTVKFAKGDKGYINYIQSDENSAVRKVGVETVLSSLYRAIKENYVIYIKLNDYGTMFNGTGDAVVDRYIATEDLVINNKTLITKGESLIKVTIGNKTNTLIDIKLRKNLFNKIRNIEFYEYFGQYQEDTLANQDERSTHRIITYIDANCL